MFITADKPLYIEREGDYVMFVRIGNLTGCLNGYIGIPMSSRYANDYYDDIPFSGIVHGGLTYSDFEQIDGRDYWVFGFDTAHVGDAPYVQSMGGVVVHGQSEGHAWNVNEVMEQLYMLLEEFKKGEQYGY